MAGITRDYRCGYCLCSYDEMTDPRVLPCDHAFCVSCLKADLQIRRKIKCPICKTNPTKIKCPICKTFPVVEDIDSLATAELASADISQEHVTKKCPCDRCDEGTAVCFCVTCGLKYCSKHQEIHSSLFGETHTTKSIAQFIETPGRYRSQTCPKHETKELIIACENCLKVVCAECDLTESECTSATGESRTHSLRSFSYMLDKLTTKYEEAAKQLADKNKEICRLEKIVWRQLGEVMDNGQKMIEKIDAITEEQINEIQEASLALKDEIRAYLKERNTQAEEYTVELWNSQEKIEAMQREIAAVLKETPSAELIADSKERQQHIDEATQLVPKKVYLEEMVLKLKGKNRGLEMGTRAAVPSTLAYQRFTDSSDVPNSVGVLSDGKCVIGLPSSLHTYNPNTGTLSTAVTCTGLLKVAVYADKVYILRKVDNSKEVRVYSADLQSSNDLTAVHNGVTYLSATESHLVLANTGTKSLTFYNLDGDQQLDILLPQNEDIQSILALNDCTVLVSHGSSVSRYRIGQAAENIWTCKELGNVWSMHQDEQSRIIYCVHVHQTMGYYSSTLEVTLLSLQGQAIKCLKVTPTRGDLVSQSFSIISVLHGMIITVGYFTERVRDNRYKMAGITREYRCGYCLCSYDEMTDPRVLPCDHAFCVSCLKADLQIRRKIKCPICKTNPTIEDIDSLAGAELANAEISQENVTKKCPCDSCDEGTAVCFCVTCGLKYCNKHQEIHNSLFGEKHAIKRIAQYLEMPGRYQSQTCPKHETKELIIACENCLKVVCAECDLTESQCASSTSGNRTHTLRSFSYMLDKLTTQYEEAAKQLADKNKEICRLEKIVWRQLGDVTDNGEKMIQKIDAVTEEQIDAIREASDALKQEIRDYLQERNTQAEDYTVELLDSLEKIETIQREVAAVLREEPIAQLISESKERQQRIDETTQMVLKKCYLEERVLASKGQSRDIEIRTRSAVPSKFTYQHYTNSSGTPYSIGVLSEGKCVIGLPTSLQIYDPSTGALSTAVNCTGLLKVAVTGDKVFVLRNIDNNKVVRAYSADLQSSNDLTTVHTGIVNLSATDRHLVLANAETKSLTFYDLDGDQQLEFQLPQNKNIQGLLALYDDTVLVSEGPSVSRYRIGQAAEAIWTYSGLNNVVSMYQDVQSGMIYCGSSNTMTVAFLTLQGELIKNIAMPSINPSYSTIPQPLNSICVVDERIIAVGNLNEHSRGTHYIRVYKVME